MINANLIIALGMLFGIMYLSIKYICNSWVIISKNRKEEAKYKYLEVQIKKELEENSKN